MARDGWLRQKDDALLKRRSYTEAHGPSLSMPLSQLPFLYMMETYQGRDFALYSLYKVTLVNCAKSLWLLKLYCVEKKLIARDIFQSTTTDGPLIQMGQATKRHFYVLLKTCLLSHANNWLHHESIESINHCPFGLGRGMWDVVKVRWHYLKEGLHYTISTAYCQSCRKNDICSELYKTSWFLQPP